jgi:hypothetical protein
MIYFPRLVYPSCRFIRILWETPEFLCQMSIGLGLKLRMRSYGKEVILYKEREVEGCQTK